MATREQIARTLEPGSTVEGFLGDKHRVDAREILMNDDRRQIYANTANLYQSLYQVQQCLTERPGKDTHQWELRLQDFDNAEEDLLEKQ